MTIRLVPLSRDDRARVRAWLRRPDVQAWWGSAGAAEAEVAIALEAASAICRLIEVDGVAAGYAHALDQGLLEEESSGIAPAGAWAAAAFIAAEAHQGKGHGATALDLLAREVFETTLAVACVVRVPVAKERAVRAIEAAGFRWLAVEAGDNRAPAWVMLRERPDRGQPASR